MSARTFVLDGTLHLTFEFFNTRMHLVRPEWRVLFPRVLFAVASLYIAQSTSQSLRT